MVGSLVVLAAGCGGETEVPPLPEGRFIAVTHSLTPLVNLFADPVLARVDVLVDGNRFDPDHVRVVGFFKPYEREAVVVRAWGVRGRYTHLRYEFTLRCLVYECLPGSEGGRPDVAVGSGALPPPTGGGMVRDRKSFRFKAARLLYDDPTRGTRLLRTLSWPEIQSVSRLDLEDVDVSVIRFPFEASVTPLPEATYRIPPTLFGIGLLVGAIALLTLPVSLLAHSLRRKATPPAGEEKPKLPPLQQALLLVEWARDREVEDRREALEVLAAELDAGEKAVLADEARKLAWSRKSPLPDSLGQLVRAVREADGTSD